MNSPYARVFGDQLYKVVNKQGKVIVYFGNLHRAIRLSYYKFHLLELVLKNDNETIDFLIKQYGLAEADVNALISQLLDRRILFRSKIDLEQSYFERKYNCVLSSRSLNKAYIHVTQRCNLNCFYCYNKANTNKRQEEFSTATWIHVLDDLYEKGVRDFVFTGGEPLLRDDLTEILKRKHSDCSFALLTNGTLLRGENQLKLLDFVDTVIISIDSLDSSSNNSNRENSIKYHIIDNLKEIPEQSRKKVFVRSVVTKNNYSDVRELESYVSDDLGLGFIASECLPNSMEDLDCFIPSFENSREQDLAQIASCGAGSSIIAIDSNGDIYPCQNLIKPEFKVANILQSNWNDSLGENDKIKQLRSGINLIKGCSTCVYKYFCGSGCKALAYNIYGELNIRNSFMCHYLQDRAEQSICNLF